MWPQSHRIKATGRLLPSCRAKQFAGSTLLTGKEATKDKLLSEGGKCDILHIATHGYADPDVPEFSGVLLAGRENLTQSRKDAEMEEEVNGFDVLTAAEVFLWNLNAKLVTLSACETGLGKDVEGCSGLHGRFSMLERRMLFAACGPFRMRALPLYIQLQTGQSVDASLQSARQTLLKDPRTSHHFYRPAFVNVKGPR